MAEEQEGITLFVGALPQDCSDAEMTAYFAQFGAVGCTVKQDHTTGRCRGFGFITMLTEEAVDKVCALHDQHQIRGKWVDVKRHAGKGGKSKGKGKGKDAYAMQPYTGGSVEPGGNQTLFCGGLASTVTSDDLKAYFSAYGTLKACEVKMDTSTDRSRGFGFIEYEDQTVTDTVLSLRDSLTIHDKWVDVKVYAKGSGKGKDKGKGKGDPYAVATYQSYGKGKGKDSYKGYGYESKGYDSYKGYGKGKAADPYAAYADPYAAYKGAAADPYAAAYAAYKGAAPAAAASPYAAAYAAYEPYGKSAGYSTAPRYSPYGV